MGKTSPEENLENIFDDEIAQGFKRIRDIDRKMTSDLFAIGDMVHDAIIEKVK